MDEMHHPGCPPEIRYTLEWIGAPGMATEDQRVQAAVAAESKSARVDFKDQFDVTSPTDWCEIVKDIVAMANSGGGCLIFGVRDDGTPSDWDPQHLLALDPAKLTDRIYKYTARDVAGFQIVPRKRRGALVAILVVDEGWVPLVFAKPGTYSLGDNRQKTAFSQGTVYFRHGAKSEPATTDDIAEFLHRRLGEERNHLLQNLRRVLQAPADSELVLVSNRERAQTENLTAGIRFTQDPGAPEFRHVNPDDAYPFRQTEVVDE